MIIRRSVSSLVRIALFCLVVLDVAEAQPPASAEKDVPRTPASAKQMFSSYEGQTISTIEIAGQPDLNEDQFAPLFALKAGEPFSEDKVNQTAAALKNTAKFEEVRIQVDPEAKGVRVLFILEPAYYIGVYSFPGSGRFPYSRLIQVANYPSQAPYSATEMEQARRSLLTFYQQQGYFQAQVSAHKNVDAAHAVVNIDFPAKLGRRAKFGDVVIAGIPEDEQQKLENSLKGLLARMREAAIRPGKPYRFTTLSRATQYLQTALQKKGLLAAQVNLAGAEYHAETNRADIHFDVKAGPKMDVEISGAHVWSWKRKSLLPMYQGVPADDETVQEGRRALASYFQGKGFFDVKVDADLKDSSKGEIISYHISKEKKHKVDEIKIRGNKALKSSDLEPHIAVEEKHLLKSGRFSDELVRTSVKNLKAVYQAEGFSAAEVVPTVTRSGGDIDVTFDVTEGPRDVVASVRVEGADTFSASQYAPQGLKIAVGQPYSAEKVRGDRTTIVSNYLKAGYLTSSFRETAKAVSKEEPHQIDVVYHIFEGPKVQAGKIVTLGRSHTRPRLIDADTTDLKTGRPMTETGLLKAGAQLYDHTGVFDWAEVDPRRQITTQNNEDVLVKVHEGKRNSITYGFGFEVINRGGNIPSGTVALPTLPPVGLPSDYKTSQKTFAGPRVTFQYTRNNIRGKGESLNITAFAGRLDQRFAIFYINPTFRWSPWKITPSISYEKNGQNPIFSSQQEAATFQIQRPIDTGQQNTLFLRYGFTRTDLTHVEIDQLVPEEDRHVRLSTLSANLTRDTRDNPLDGHKGVLDSIELDFDTSKLGSSVDFMRMTAQAAIYKQKFHNIVWANSIRIGLAQALRNSRVPLSEEFFTGGGNSLRGFPLDGAGPQRNVEVCSSGQTANCPQISVPKGGNELLVINSEARIPLPMIKQGLSIVPFYDGGNVFARVGFHDFTSLYSNSVGIGARYATPVGPIRIDLGHNLNPVNGVKSTQYFISIGQAF